MENNNGGPFQPISSVQKRVATALKISVKTVCSLKKKNANIPTFPTSPSRTPRLKLKTEDLPEGTKMAVRNTLYNMYEQNHYMKARNKAKDAEETSDLASEMETNSKRRSIQKVLSSSGSSDETILPSPPKRCMVKKIDISDNGQLNNETAVRIPPFHENIVVENVESVAIAQQENLNQYCCQGCKDNASNLKVIIEQNHLIRSITTEILSAIKEKGERDTVERRHGSRCLYTDYDIHFPINCVEDLEKFEEVLKKEDNFEAAVIELAKLGGANNYNFVKRAMTSLISNEEASGFSWLGRKGKKPFINLLMAKLVLNAAEYAKKAKDRKETEVSLQSWLKRASERKQSSTKKF